MRDPVRDLERASDESLEALLARVEAAIFLGIKGGRAEVTIEIRDAETVFSLASDRLKA